MGIFYYFHSVALAEDLPEVELDIKNLNKFYSDIDRGYSQVKKSINSSHI